MDGRANDEQIYKKLSQLRLASNSNDWTLCREILQSLVCDIDPQLIRSLIFKYIKQFMNNELCARVGIDLTTKVRSLRIVTSSIKEKLTGDNAQLAQILYEPGVSNFRGTLSRIIDFLQLDYCTERYAEGFTSVISGLFMALLLQKWGEDNLELWYKWRMGITTDDMAILSKHFWRHPKTIKLSGLLWSQIVDCIEEVTFSK